MALIAPMVAVDSADSWPVVSTPSWVAVKPFSWAVYRIDRSLVLREVKLAVVITAN